MAAHPRITQLVERFKDNLDAYKRGKYKEAQLRREFIDPFFGELGWDVQNTQGYAEAYKDVIHEDTIKIGGYTKAPDYCFRIGGVRKFFLEAKRPSTDVKDDVSPAYQLRRYAWSAKLPLSILSDFEEFAIYDCRVKPGKTDKASTARTVYMTFEEYADRWEEIAGVFSREAILKGSFDKYVESSRLKRGTAEVDNAFLEEIERWRTILARNVALRNPGLSQKELNFAVQRTIDRIIFLRICEDRGIESYGELMALQNGPRAYPRLFELFRKADDRYNSGLFHFRSEKGRPGESLDALTSDIKIDDKVLRDVIKNLYYPDSPYEFSVLPADILGQVYERFLGSVIRLTPGHRAVVEEKPEVRKAGGVYYTPTYIVDYIVKNTVGELVKDKKPGPRGAVSNLRILDPACGSGSFLLGAYQYLLDWHRDEYAKKNPEKWAKGRKPRLYQGPGGEWKLTTDERKRILLNNIYGVDIDSQAVEVTKLSLLLKVLEGENQETIESQLRLFQERALPDLSNNIKCGNSLIGPDFYEGKQMSLLDDEELQRINAFDWNTEFPGIMRAGGFDAVIGNPPYDVMEKDRGAASWPHLVLNQYVKNRPSYQAALGGKLNLYRFFVVQGISLVRSRGYFGMIIPLSLLADASCSRTRRHVLLSLEGLWADCFPQKDNARRRVFAGAKLSTMVLSGNRRDQVPDGGAEILVRVYPWNRFNDGHTENRVRLCDLHLIDPKSCPIPLADAPDWELCRRIHRCTNVVRLGDEGTFEVRRGEINQTVYREFIHSDPSLVRLLKGVEVGRFHLIDRISQGQREWFDELAFLAQHREKPTARLWRIATQRITGVDERLRIVATMVEPVTYFADSTNSISVLNSSRYRLEYLLGLLNSKLFQWRFKLTSTNNNVGTNELVSMPFRQVNFDDRSDVADYDKLVREVEEIVNLHRRVAGLGSGQPKTEMKRQIEATSSRIEDLVYDLYGLTDDEIRIVEGAVPDRSED